MEKIAELLRRSIESDVLENEPMNGHTSFKTGGNADLFIPLKSIEDLKKALIVLKENEVPVTIMGNGTNLLVGDKGIRGAVLQLYQFMNDITVKDCFLEAQSGALLSAIAAQALSYGLKGFEFASGIPGSLGGAVCMNAGAYDGEMKNVLHEVLVLTSQGEIKTIAAGELGLGYRKSIIPTEKMIVLKGVLKLEEGDKTEIADRIAYLSNQRKEKQPLNFPSAGSTFKRPEGYFAGKLITDAGLKGYCIGGAAVSEKHAGFVINQNNATSADILNLIQHIQKTVFEKFGVKLETEVKIIGEQ